MDIGHFVCFRICCTSKNTSISFEAHTQAHDCLREVRKQLKEHIFRAQPDKKNYQITEFIAAHRAYTTK